MGTVNIGVDLVNGILDRSVIVTITSSFQAFGRFALLIECSVDFSINFVYQVPVSVT